MNKPNKTQKTNASVEEYLEAVTPEQKKQDCFKILEMLKNITGHEPVMWGSIVGFGSYHYKYDSGREGYFLRVGFTARARDISIHILPGYQDFHEERSRLGKHKMGKSCLYINKLSDIDEDVLIEMINKGYKIMAETYPE